MPRVLYLVTAHSQPEQITRLIQALLTASPAGEVLLHIDPSAIGAPAADWVASPRVHVHPHPRAVRWGDFSLVEAMLAGAAWAFANISFDWLIWISGQDYPLGSLDDFENMLHATDADGYMRYFRVDTHEGWPTGEGLRRYGFAYRDLPSFPYFYRLPRPAQRALCTGIRRFNTAQSLVQLRQRHRNNPAKLGWRRCRTPFSTVFPCIGGWSWLNLNRRAVARLLEFVAARPDYVAYYQRCYCPDESFFHTVLVNDPTLKIENDALRYVYWGGRRYPSSPGVITRGPVLDAALASGMPFGRKFDLKIDAGCFDELDARIRAGTRHRAACLV